MRDLTPTERAAIHAEVEADPIQRADRDAGRMPKAFRRAVVEALIEDITAAGYSLLVVDRFWRLFLHPAAAVHWETAQKLAPDLSIPTEAAIAILDAALTSPQAGNGVN